VRVDATLEHDEPARDLALEVVGHADDRALGDVRVTGQRGLDRAGRQPVPGDVEHVVGAPHDVEVAVLVDHPAVTGEVVAVVHREVAGDVALVVLPQGRQGAGRQRQLDGDRALVAGRHRLAGVVEHLHVVAGHAHRRRARLDRHRLQAAQVRRDRPAGLGLPPVVDDRHAEHLAGPLVGVGVEALAGEEEVCRLDRS
jgi:hypothetical protein